MVHRIWYSSTSIPGYTRFIDTVSMWAFLVRFFWDRLSNKPILACIPHDTKNHKTAKSELAGESRESGILSFRRLSNCQFASFVANSTLSEISLKQESDGNCATAGVTVNPRPRRLIENLGACWPMCTRKPHSICDRAAAAAKLKAARAVWESNCKRRWNGSAR